MTVLETGVRVGAARKAVRAIGDRRVLVGHAGNLSFSPATAFTEMPLLWDHAYGGRDEHAERLFAEDAARKGDGRSDSDLWSVASVTYPRNGAGRGYALDLDRYCPPRRFSRTEPGGSDRPLSRLTWLLSTTTNDWIDCPVAACFAPIDVFTFPRAAFFIRHCIRYPPARPVHELGTGAVFREDLERKSSTRAIYRTGACSTPRPRVSRFVGLKAPSASAFGTCMPNTSCWSSTLPDDRPQPAHRAPRCPRHTWSCDRCSKAVLIERANWAIA